MKRAEFTHGEPIEAPRDWLAAGQESALDCETGSWLRAYLGPIFAEAGSWAELIGRLAEKGYRLSMQEARLILEELETGRAICTGRYLNAALPDLVARLGKPCVVATGGATGLFRH